MPNIYLRLPSSRCQFFRHRDLSNILEKGEPLIMNAYSPGSFVLRNSLTNAQAVTQEINTHCFSHQQWRNMMCGRDPLGNTTIVKRNKNAHLSLEEVFYLCGKRDYSKSMNEDYLCIKLPNEIEVVDTVKVITPSWNIDKHGVKKLTDILNNNFKRSVIEWVLSTFDFCTSNGRVVCRSQKAMLERFMMRYGIEPTLEETDSMRRVIERWLGSEQNHFKAYSCFDLQYIDKEEQEIRIKDFVWD